MTSTFPYVAEEGGRFRVNVFQQGHRQSALSSGTSRAKFQRSNS